MPSEKTVKKWNFPQLGYSKNREGDINKIWCKICREIFRKNEQRPKYRGFVASEAETYITGTSVVKKNNFSEHLTSNMHKTAMSRLNEAASDSLTKAKQDSADKVKEVNLASYFHKIPKLQSLVSPQPTTSSNILETALLCLTEATSDLSTSMMSSEAVPVTISSTNTSQDLEDVSRQASLPYFYRLPQSQRLQLTKKFQTAHFTASKAKGFRLYEDICDLNKRILQVDLGSEYAGRKSAAEMVHYLSKSIQMKQITESVNDGKIRYFSILCDSSSHIKTMAYKELYLLKSASLGTAKFSVISLEQPKEITAKGLKKSLDNALNKMNFTVPRQDKEVGMCTDGTHANITMQKLVQEEIGGHHTLVLCSSHRVELAIRDAFEQSTCDVANQRNLDLVYHFFKRENFRWRLFKSQARFMKYKYCMYKRSNGTRWTEHQLSSLSSYLDNFPVFVAFLKQQIDSPHKSMTDIKVKLMGLQRQICTTDELIFASAKHDLLSMLAPITKELQSCDLISPELLTKCKVAMNDLQKVKLLNSETRAAIFEECPLFLQTKPILSQLFPIRNTATSDLQMRSASESFPNCEFYGYTLLGNIEASKKKVAEEIDNIVEKLIESLWIRLSTVLDNKLLGSMSIFLDTKSYIYYEDHELTSAIDVIVQQFGSLLRANDCKIDLLHNELKFLHEHVKMFGQDRDSRNVWPQLFANQMRLGITNVLHIAELCLVFPLSNAESGRVFSFLWQALSKERQSLSDSTLEDILRLRCDNDFSPDKYCHAIDLFLAAHPDGSLRKRRSSLTGVNQPANKRNTSADVHSINIEEISDDLWSTSSDEEEFIGV